MKRLFLIFLVFFGCIVVSNGQNDVTILPEYPMPGDSVIITFTPEKVIDQIPVVHFRYSNFYELPREMKMKKDGEQWKVSFQLPDYAVFATFILDIGNKSIQPSPDKHFAIFVFNDKKHRVKSSYLYEGYSLRSQEGKSSELPQRQAALYAEELVHYPNNYEAKLRLLSYKISVASVVKKGYLLGRANEIIAANFYQDPGNMGLTNRTTMGYLIMGEKSRLDSLREVIKENFPESEAGYELRINDITSLKDSIKMVYTLEKLLEKENEANRRYLTTAHEVLFEYYAGKGNEGKALYQLSFLNKTFTPYTPRVLKDQAEILYDNSLALDTALAMAKRSLSYADTFPVSLIRYFPETGYLPSYVSREERKASIKEVTGQIKSLMALIELKQGKVDEAKALIAAALNVSNDNETLKNAGAYFNTTSQFKSAFKVYQEAALHDPYDTLSYRLMKTNYKQWKGSEKGLERYVARIEKHWMAEMTKELEKEIISVPLPDVLSHYVDLKGNPVPASLIKNKIVVMDFWATWCVPCMHAMPYMEKAYQKFKNDPDVVFMIVNSGSKNSLKDAQNWWGNKKFAFPVYYNKDRAIGDKLGFNVIPATYIIDKAGNIRFETIGFEGESTTRKLTAQIEMLKGE